MNNIIIREATLADAEQIARVHVQAWQETYKDMIAEKDLNSITYKYRLEFRKKYLSKHDDETIHLVAVNNQGEIIGFCDAGPIRDGTPVRGEIYTIYILDKYKGMGIGKAFWNRAVDHLVNHELTPYIAWTLAANTIAIKFYEKHAGSVGTTKMTNMGECGDSDICKKYGEICYIFDKPVLGELLSNEPLN